MRSLLTVSFLGFLAGVVVCQDDQLPKTKKPDRESPTLLVYPTAHLGKKVVDSTLPWFRAFAGERGMVDYKPKSGHLLVKADRAGHRRVKDVLAWVAASTPPQVEVTVSELVGDAERLKLVAKSASPVLADREAVTHLLRAAEKCGGVRLKSFPTQKLSGRAPVVLGKGQRKALVVGATRLRGQKFLAKTWSPDAPCTEMRCGQTLVVDDVEHGRLILVRFDKVIAKRLPPQIVPVAPVLLAPAKRQPEPPKGSNPKRDPANGKSFDRGSQPR